MTGTGSAPSSNRTSRLVPAAGALLVLILVSATNMRADVERPAGPSGRAGHTVLIDTEEGIGAPLIADPARQAGFHPQGVEISPEAFVPPTGIPTLRLTQVAGQTRLSWSEMSLAPLYDVVRGVLGSLHATGGDFFQASGACILDDRAVLTVNDPQNPLPGAGFWYLVRGLNCDGPGTYDSGGSAQVGQRDLEIDASELCTPEACVPGTDSDLDRLDNCFENGSGLFCGPTNTGSSALLSDTDGDYLRDGDEVLGTLGGLALPALGANPNHKDLFIEYDWFDDGIDCGAHSHRPTAAMVGAVSVAFANAPVANPDGTNGIAMHHDYGQGAPFTGGNFVADADGVLSSGVNSSEFVAIKTANLAAARTGAFHYVVLPHRYNGTSSSSGQAELPGDDMIVSLYCAFSTVNVANTIVHELGHNLLIRHGGFENCNYKPNYNSVMNYKYQFPGVDTNCTPPGNGLLDYSRGTRIDLDENALNENAGTCGTTPWDWNGNSVIENPVVRDINVDGGGTPQNGGCAAALTTLRDSNDWAAAVFTGLSDADFGLIGIQEIIDCDNPAPPIDPKQR